MSSMHGNQVSVAVLSIWNDIDPEIEADYEAWYQRDHLRDRVGTAGFRSCRRYLRVRGDGRQYFTFSDLDSLEACRSPEYLERLAHATDWTRRIMPHFRRLIRVAAHVSVDRGDGTGAFAATALYEQPDAAARGRIRQAIEAGLDQVMHDPRITRARVFEGSPEATGVPNPEAALRPDPPRTTDLAIVLEGTFESSLARHLEAITALPALTALKPSMSASVYRLLFSSRS